MINKKFEFLYQLTYGERLVSEVVGVVCFSVGKPSDFHDTAMSVSPSLFKV